MNDCIIVIIALTLWFLMPTLIDLCLEDEDVDN